MQEHLFMAKKGNSEVGNLQKTTLSHHNSQACGQGLSISKSLLFSYL